MGARTQPSCQAGKWTLLRPAQSRTVETDSPREIRRGLCQRLFLCQRLDRNHGGKMVSNPHSFHNGGTQSPQLGHTIKMEAALQGVPCTANPLAWQSLVVDVVWRGPAVESAWLSGGSHCSLP